MTGPVTKRMLTAYAAGILAIGGLMAIVAMGTNAVTPTNPTSAVVVVR